MYIGLRLTAWALIIGALILLAVGIRPLRNECDGTRNVKMESCK